MNKLIIDTLGPLKVPVCFQKYSGTEAAYITFFEYLNQNESYADNKDTSTGHYMQIDIWSKEDYTALRDKVIVALENAGFSKVSETEMYENDTQIYHKSLRVFYLQNN